MRTCSACGAVYADTTGSDCPVCRGSSVIDINTARRKRDQKEERRLEQLVIERWTGKEPSDG